MNLVYLISSTFDYSSLICADAGPEYAFRLGIPTVDFSSPLEDFSSVILVDTRLAPAEIEAVRSLVKMGKRILLRANDPCFDFEMYSPQTKLIFESAKLNNVALVLSYTPREITYLMSLIYGARRTYHLPFPYIDSLEQSTKAPRKNSAIISGARVDSIYPLRGFAIRKRNRSLVWRLKSDVLKHPGYKDIQHNVSDSGVRGCSYIALLTRYKFMFLCPSRAKVELLKYSECAYALCCPVGEPADSLPDDAKDAFLLFQFNSWRSCIKIMSSIRDEEIFDRAMKYRSAMKSARQPRDLLIGLLNWASETV